MRAFLPLVAAVLWAWPAHAQSPACPLSVPINQTSSTILVAGISGQRIAVCSLVLVNAIAQNVSLVEGTAAACGTNTVGLIGGATASLALPTTGILALPSPVPIFRTSVSGDSLCLLQSGASNVSGFLTYSLQLAP